MTKSLKSSLANAGKLGLRITVNASRVLKLELLAVSQLLAILKGSDAGSEQPRSDFWLSECQRNINKLCTSGCARNIERFVLEDWRFSKVLTPYFHSQFSTY